MGAIGFGGNSVIDGGTQFFRREGGVNLIGEGFGAYGNWMAGEEGEATAKYWIGWSGFLFELAGGAGLTKVGNTPLRQLPGATRQALQRAFLRGSPGNLAKTPIAIEGSTGSIEIANGVGKLKIAFVEQVSESFFRTIQQLLKVNGAKSLIVEFQASNTDLAIQLGQRMQQGRTLLGGRIEIIVPGKCPVFRITFDTIP